jgi:hypothetical protein
VERGNAQLSLSRPSLAVASVRFLHRKAGLANCSLQPVCNPTTGAQIAWQVDAGQMEMI